MWKVNLNTNVPYSLLYVKEGEMANFHFVLPQNKSFPFGFVLCVNRLRTLTTGGWYIII